MKHLNIVVPDNCHEHLQKRKREWNLRTLDEVVAKIIKQDMEVML